MDQNKIIITGIVATVAAALISSAMFIPAFAAQQNKNGSSNSGINGTNADGMSGQNGGVGGDATKGGIGENGGNNHIP